MSIEPVEIYDEKKDEPIPFDFENRLVWSEPEKGEFGAGAQKGTFYRLKLKYKNSAGLATPFVVHLGKTPTFGVQISTAMEDPTKQTGFSCSFALHTYDNGKIVPTKKDLAKEKFFNDVREFMKNYLLQNEVKQAIGKPKLVEAHLDKLKVVRYSEDKKTGERIPDRSPMLNTKLICSKKNGLRIVTKFYLENMVDADGNFVEIEPEELMEGRNAMDGYILIEGIYVGADIYSQIKLWEAHLTPFIGGGLQKMKKNVECVTVMSSESPYAKFLKSDTKKSKEHKMSKEQVNKKINDNAESDDEDGTTNPMNLNTLPPAPPSAVVESSDTKPRRSRRNAPPNGL